MTDTNEAGWLADPSRRHQYRYWDGTTWTDQVADDGRQGIDPLGGAALSPASQLPTGPAPAPAGAPAGVPTKVCRSCGAQNHTTGPRCPTCNKRYRKPRVWLWVLLGVFAVFGGCSAVLVAGVNNAVNELNREQRLHAITPAQYEAVPLGASQDQVISQLGKAPENVQEFKSKGILTDADLNSSCIYYNKSGGKFGDRYQFCFDDSGLRSKNYYG